MGDEEAQLHSFLTSALGGSGQFHVPATLPLGEEPPAPVTLAAVETPHTVRMHRTTGNPLAPVNCAAPVYSLCHLCYLLPHYKIKMCKKLKKKKIMQGK